MSISNNRIFKKLDKGEGTNLSKINRCCRKIPRLHEEEEFIDQKGPQCAQDNKYKRRIIIKF